MQMIVNSDNGFEHPGSKFWQKGGRGKERNGTTTVNVELAQEQKNELDIHKVGAEKRKRGRTRSSLWFISFCWIKLERNNTCFPKH